MSFSGFRHTSFSGFPQSFFSLFPVFRHFFGAFLPFCHTYNAPTMLVSLCQIYPCWPSEDYTVFVSPNWNLGWMGGQYFPPKKTTSWTVFSTHLTQIWGDKYYTIVIMSANVNKTWLDLNDLPSILLEHLNCPWNWRAIPAVLLVYFNLANLPREICEIKLHTMVWYDNNCGICLW